MNDNPTFRFSLTRDATASYLFNGTGVKWLGYKFDDAGLAEVSIDGNLIAVVDQYGPGRKLPFDWSVANLPMGWHTIQVRVMAQRRSPSINNYINVEGFLASGPKMPVKALSAIAANNQVTINFAAQPCATYDVQRTTTSLASGGWATVSGTNGIQASIAGLLDFTDLFEDLNVPPYPEKALYRLKSH